ncbi:unnamed protein product [Amoebophrya sp. A25]|nr:unnamed protein product [Amoebophrya sp. A25]|eukprot:GSA25T00018936001.1
MRYYLSKLNEEDDTAVSKNGVKGKAGSRKKPVYDLAEYTTNFMKEHLKYDFGPAEEMTAGHAGESASAENPNDDSGGSAEKQDQKNSDTSSTDVDDYENESRRKNDEAIDGKTVSQVVKDTTEESMAMSVGQEAGLSELLAWNYHGEEAREKAKKENNGQYKPPDNVPLVDVVLSHFRLYRSHVAYERPESFVEAFKCIIAKDTVCEVASTEVDLPLPQTPGQQCREVGSRLKRLRDLALYSRTNNLVSDKKNIVLGDDSAETERRMRLWKGFWELLIDESLRSGSEGASKHMIGLVDAYCRRQIPVYVDGLQPPVFLFGVVEDFRAPWLLGSEFFVNGYSHDWYPAYNRRSVLSAMYLAVHDALDVFVLMPDPSKKNYKSRVFFEELIQIMAFFDAGVVSVQPLTGENEERFNLQVLQIMSSAEMSGESDDAFENRREIEDLNLVGWDASVSKAINFSRLRARLRAFAFGRGFRSTTVDSSRRGPPDTHRAANTMIELTKQTPPVGQMYIPPILIPDAGLSLWSGAGSDTYASVFTHDLKIVLALLEEKRKRKFDTPSVVVFQCFPKNFYDVECQERVKQLASKVDEFQAANSQAIGGAGSQNQPWSFLKVWKNDDHQLIAFEFQHENAVWFHEQSYWREFNDWRSGSSIRRVNVNTLESAADTTRNAGAQRYVLWLSHSELLDGNAFSATHTLGIGQHRIPLTMLFCPAEQLPDACALHNALFTPRAPKLASQKDPVSVGDAEPARECRCRSGCNMGSDSEIEAPAPQLGGPAESTSTLQLQERPSKLRRPNSPNTAFVAVEAER